MKKIDYLKLYKKSRLYKAPKKCIVFFVWWCWVDIGFCVRVNKQEDWSDYRYAIDIQILWFDLWIQFFRNELPMIKLTNL